VIMTIRNTGPSPLQAALGLVKCALLYTHQATSLPPPATSSPRSDNARLAWVANMGRCQKIMSMN
jgi:hypothetical protein